MASIYFEQVESVLNISFSIHCQTYRLASERLPHLLDAHYINFEGENLVYTVVLRYLKVYECAPDFPKKGFC